jgi:hypothetical protein
MCVREVKGLLKALKWIQHIVVVARLSTNNAGHSKIHATEFDVTIEH